ncbi:MAG: TetR family transcriptional regulator [Microbacterium sp.]|nr:TetR family transcriptional regulator [Microbacterium sp.]
MLALIARDCRKGDAESRSTRSREQMRNTGLMTDGSKPRRGRPLGGTELNRQHVLTVALELVDRDGLSGLTMRSLAAAMGVRPSALYWHFQTKDQLLGEVSALVFDNIEVGDDHGTEWDAWLAGLARKMRAALHEHPHFAGIVTGQMLTTDRGVPLAERIFRVLDRAGFSSTELVEVYNVFFGVVLGWVTMELSAAPEGDDGWQETLSEDLRTIDSTLFPTLSRVMPLAEDRAFMLRWTPGRDNPLDSSFEVVLETLFVGLRARLV